MKEWIVWIFDWGKINKRSVEIIDSNPFWWLIVVGLLGVAYGCDWFLFYLKCTSQMRLSFISKWPDSITPVKEKGKKSIETKVFPFFFSPVVVFVDGWSIRLNWMRKRVPPMPASSIKTKKEEDNKIKAWCVATISDCLYPSLCFFVDTFCFKENALFCFLRHFCLTRQEQNKQRDGGRFGL